MKKHSCRMTDTEKEMHYREKTNGHHMKMINCDIY